MNTENNKPIQQEPLPPINLYRERRRLAIPAIAVAFAFLLTTALQLILVFLVSTFCPQMMDRDWYVWVMSMVPLYAVAMPLSLLIYRAEPVREQYAKRKLGVGAFLGLLAVCFALSYLGNYLGQIINAIIGSITGTPPTNDLEELTIASPLWTNLLFCGILAPIMEEIFYRKVLIDRLRHFGDLPAVLISGVVFGLIHGNFYQFFYAAMIGVLFGYVYVYTGRIRYTIALHTIFNMVGGVYSTEMIKRIDLERLVTDPVAEVTQHMTGFLMMMGYFAFILAAFMGAIVAVIVFFFKKPPRLLLQKSERPLTAAEWARVGLLNPGVWILAAVILLLFL
jgi:membrane protease YdiL (CAAX protease family)